MKQLKMRVDSSHSPAKNVGVFHFIRGAAATVTVVVIKCNYSAFLIDMLLLVVFLKSD